MEFRVVGSRLVPLVDQASDETVPTRVFDVATGHAVQFRLPERVPPRSRAGFDTLGDPDALTGNDSFPTIQWLDDDTIALRQGVDNSGKTIITCHLSDGQLPHRRQGGSTRQNQRIVAGGSLPG